MNSQNLKLFFFIINLKICKFLFRPIEFFKIIKFKNSVVPTSLCVDLGIPRLNILRDLSG